MIGTWILGYGYGVLLTMPINAVLLVSMIACYVVSIKTLKEHHRRRQHLSSTDRNIVLYAKLYLYVIAGCFAPTILSQIVMPLIPVAILNKIDIYLTLVFFVTIQMQSTISAIVFIKVNQASRQVIVSFLERYPFLQIILRMRNQQVVPRTNPPLERNIRMVRPIKQQP